MLVSALAGLALGLSLIVAIGAQNAFVLRQGLRREHIVPVILVCAVSDAVLIALGVGGAGLVLEQLPWLIEVVRWAGFAFLFAYGLLAARRAVRPKALTPTEAQAPKPLGAVVATVLALTWLNPHVYLDTVVLLGSISNTHGDQRWAFAAGAAVGSILWFTALGLGARLLAPLFAKPAAWRVLDGVIAVVMIALAIGLVLPH
ncbi:MAG TPA: LysE/ArgO family amino acid transporter [Rhodoglobus sp.]|nr:LysE/ArgO family amino acid transporter [Rhodoglobus sp.]